MVSKTDYLPDIVQHFKQNGLKLIGQGYHAAVFQSRKTGEVVKVFHKDKCYVAFLGVLANNPSVHFPRINSHVALKGKYIGYHIVKMEKLKSTISDLTDYVLLENMREVFGCYLRISENRDIMHSKFRLEQKLASFVAENKTLCDALDVLARSMKTIPCSIDLKADNIMRRDDGTIVVIDPFASFG